MSDKTEIVAIYFPSWHPNDHYSAWYGPGFTEWELVRSARPLYEGHYQPKTCLWGCFDESDPAWSAREIDLAADHGITTFLFDWYWYCGVQIMQEALENGFLRAPNRNRLKFAIMWANHSWGAWPATTGIPGMGSLWQGPQSWLPIRHSPEDLDRVIDYCCEHYFFEPNYWKVDGCPNFVLYDVNEFVLQLGGLDNAKAAVERVNRRAAAHGLPGLYLTANIGCCDGNVYCCGWERVPGVRECGFESVFAYNIVRTEGYHSLSEYSPVVLYDDVIESHRYVWRQIEQFGVPHHPVVTVGCDNSPRWHRGVSLPMDFRGLRYEPIVEGNTPEKFGELCRLALRQAAENGSRPRAVYVNAWNEWTEGMYLLPDDKDGAGRLEALKGALAACSQDVLVTGNL